MKAIMNRFLALSATVLLAAPAMAQSEITADTPSTVDSAMQVIPVIGVSSFQATATPDFDRLDGDPSIGLLANFGKGMIHWEVGVIALETDLERPADSTFSVQVDTWGIPLLAKFNLFEQPSWHLFIKGGVMPVSVREVSGFNVTALGAVGGQFEVTENLDLMVEGAYSQLVTKGGDLGNFSGMSVLSGLVFEL